LSPSSDDTPETLFYNGRNPSSGRSMSEPREPRSIIAAAEQAAVAGDYVAAERLLREAALAQEASLGPLHPELAHTLNNLGVVCEMTGNPVDAEHCFRRALDIAETVLESDHPFVITSRKNLHDFCEARGTPVDLPTSSPAASLAGATTPETQATTSEDPQSELTLEEESQDLPVVAARSIPTHAIRFLGPGAMLIVIVAAASPWLGSTERTESSSAAIATDSREMLAPRVPVPVEPIPVPRETTKPAKSGLAGVSASTVPAASTTARPIVVRAQLCAELYEWQCDPPDDPVPGGPLFFYTQVKSTRATTIQHRWYRDTHLHQSVELRVQASPSAGYRTYSRNTMNGDITGSWRVELTTQDGVVLHEERFSVR